MSYIERIRQPIEIQRNITASDGMGGSGLVTWIKYRRVIATITQRSGSMVYQDGGFNSDIPYIFVFRAPNTKPVTKENMRILYRNRVVQIDYVRQVGRLMVEVGGTQMDQVQD